MKRSNKKTGTGAESPLSFAVSQRDRDTLKMVEDAVAHKETMLAYQPVVLARNQETIGFYEGLIRVLDETGRVIPAKDFMPVVEETGLGREIDVIALTTGLQALQDHPRLRLSINMSAKSMGHAAWSSTLHNVLRQEPTLGERLILEITETSAMEVPEIVADFTDEWQEHGVCFALDDFGAGHTAIRYFKDFNFDVLKIDAQFIQGIAGDPDNQALVAALVSIAEHFGMLTVAEAVEVAEDAATLATLGIDCLQGYYFGAPTIRPDWALSDQHSEAG